MKIQTAFVLLVAVGAAASVGCGSSNDQPSAIGTVRASLHRAKSCGDLLADLKADAAFKLDRSIDREIAGIRSCVSRYGEKDCAYGGGYYRGGGSRGEVAMPEAAPTDSGSAGAGDRASSYSETNTQVKGVDEADIVKTDGQNLYVLHGRSFKVLKAWPVNELNELASFDVEGQPTEMFVDGGKVVIYSHVNGVEVYEKAGIVPKDAYREFGYLPGDVGRSDAAIGPGGYPGSSGPFAPLSKITVLTLDGATPSLARELYFEGDYLDSRRVGSHVRTVLSGYAHGPRLKHGVWELLEAEKVGGATDAVQPQTATEMIALLERLRADNRGTIDASTLDDWLPNSFVREGASVVAQRVACEDFYVPTAGSTQSGITTVASIDLAAPSITPRQSAILGNVQTVYGGANTLYLASNAWVDPPFHWYDQGGGRTGGDTAIPLPTESPPVPEPAIDAGVRTANVRTTNLDAPNTGSITMWSQSRTHVHKFEFDSDITFPNYVASGSVAGSVKDQFSLDDKDGFLRISTTESRAYVDSDGRWIAPTSDPANPGSTPSSVNRVFILGEDGPWLEVKGDVGELAPNEQIYSTRFVGNRGYVVTFRQVDPLFVLDLSNPAAPQKLAELKIPGFSEYMHPLDENHILTIGRDATDQGMTLGLQLQIFDVTNGANPILKHKVSYGGEYGYSEASHDHKAFTYFADKKLLAFPYVSYGENYRSSLELFRIDTGAGFTKIGSIDHSTLVSSNQQGYCGGYYGPQVRRGVFLENFVFSISYGGVVVKDANDLALPGQTLPLSSPQGDPSLGYACY